MSLCTHFGWGLLDVALVPCVGLQSHCWSHLPLTPWVIRLVRPWILTLYYLEDAKTHLSSLSSFPTLWSAPFFLLPLPCRLWWCFFCPIYTVRSRLRCRPDVLPFASPPNHQRQANVALSGCALVPFCDCFVCFLFCFVFPFGVLFPGGLLWPQGPPDFRLFPWNEILPK